MTYKILAMIMLQMQIIYKQLSVGILIICISFSVSAQVESPTQILLTFSEPMSRETIFDTDNYKVTADGSIVIKVLKVGLVEGDSSVVLFLETEDRWQSFQITVYNLMDKAGNLINTEKNHAEFGTNLTNKVAVKLLDDK